MKRQFVAGVMGLAVAGCAHFRSDAPKGPPATNPAGPVGMQPVPSIYDTINRGTGNPAMAQSALGNPSDPQWAGQAPAPNPNGPGAAPAPSPSQAQQPPQMAAASPSGAPAAGQWSGPTARPAPATQPSLASQPGPATQPGLATQPAGVPDESITMPGGDLKAVAAAAALPAGSAALSGDPGAPAGQPAQDPTAMPPSTAAGMAAVPGTNPATGAPGVSPASSIPSTLERPGGPMPEMLARPGGLADPATGSPSAAPAGDIGLVGAMPGAPPQTDPNGPTVAGPTLNGLMPVGDPPASLGGMAPAPADPAVNPSAGRSAQVPAPRTTSPQPAGDPLLGPNPDLMPELPALPDKLPSSPPAATASPAAPSASPASAPTLPAAGPATPAVNSPSPGPADAPPALAPSSDAAAAPPGPSAAPPPDLGPPSADNRPGGPGPAAGSVQLADLPALAPVPSTGQVSGATIQQTVASADSPIPVRRATARRDGQVLRTSLPTQGDEHLAAEISRTRRRHSIPLAKVGDDVITANDLNEFVRDHLRGRNDDLGHYPPVEQLKIKTEAFWQMVDQYLLIQEAKRVIHDPKHFDQFTRELNDYWKEVELLQLECQYHADDERQLREKFKEQGRSLDVHYKTFSRTFMSENWLHAKLKSKVKADMPEMLKYYNDHINDKEYNRTATIVWHEILVDTRRYPSRAEARKKVEAIMDQLRRGADFARLATAHSDGPSRSREQGGLMETSPGTYGIESVNAALQNLPIGKLSAILEGPDSYHIVRIDRRRAAGPAPFEELQDEIRTKIKNRKFLAAKEEYMKRLRAETPLDTFGVKGLERPESGGPS